jgi:hypothetical protein
MFSPRKERTDYRLSCSRDKTKKEIRKKFRNHVEKGFACKPFKSHLLPKRSGLKNPAEIKHRVL